jgi:hypothetical protein
MGVRMAGKTCMHGRRELLLLFFLLVIGSACGPLEGSRTSPDNVSNRDGATPHSPSQDLSHGSQLTREHVGLPSGWKGVASGAITTTAHGQVIEGRDIQVSEGTGIRVRHNDVVIRHNRIRHGNGTDGVTVDSGATGTLVEFNEFDGRGEILGNYGSIGVAGGTHATIHRNFFANGRAGATGMRTGTVVVENWVDNLVIANGSHGNGFSYHGPGAGGVQFLRNRTVASNSGGLSFYARQGAVVDSAIRDNLVVGLGRGFAIYGGYTPAGSTADHHHNNRNIKIDGNRFTGTFGWPTVLGESTNAAVNLAQPGNTFTNNRRLNNTPHGNELPPRCGVTQDACQH